jgi:hypothetical protein
MFRKWSRKKYNGYRLERRIKAKETVFFMLGDKCAHCGNADKRVLQLDHKHGRHGEPRIDNLWEALLYGVEPFDKYQLLCANCNWIKRHENNECKINLTEKQQWMKAVNILNKHIDAAIAAGLPVLNPRPIK